MVEPGAVWAAVTIDGIDPQRASEIWSRLLAAPVRTTGLSGWFRIGPTAAGGPFITFQPVREEKAGKNRIHLDIWVDELDETIALVGVLGGRCTGSCFATTKAR